MTPASRKRDEGEERKKSTSHMLHTDPSQEPTKYIKKKRTKGIELNKTFYQIAIPLIVIVVGSLISYLIISALRPTAPAINSFSASPQSIDKGELTTLAWDVSNATSVNIQPEIGDVSLSGTRLVRPDEDVTFILTATNKSDSVQATAQVFVSGPGPVSETLPPVINSFIASPGSIARGDSSTLQWNVANASKVSIDQGIGDVSLTGSRAIEPTRSSTFTLTATNSGGTMTATAAVVVSEPQPPAVYIPIPIPGSGTPTGPAQTSATGTIAFKSDRVGNEDIYVMNANGSGQTNISKNPAYDGEPAWSPDNTKIAFGTDRDGNQEIYVMSASGSGQTRLTNNAAIDAHPAWSPDGTKIAFRSNRDGNYEIYVMNADGSNPTNLSKNGANDAYAAWSPDGKKIAFRSNRDGNYEIYVMNADGSNPTNLSRNGADDAYPEWSADSTKITFRSDRDGNYEIYVMNADGSNPTNISRNSARDNYPTWSPDGKYIAFMSDREGKQEIYIMDASGSNQINISRYNSADDAEPAWSSAGGVVTPACETEIDYKRTGGIAGFNDHLVICSDGHCRLQCQNITKEFELAPGDLTKLRQLFQQAGFFSLNSEYLPANVCCDRFEYIITYRTAGRQYTVRTMSGTVPAALAPVLSQLDQIIYDNCPGPGGGGSGGGGGDEKIAFMSNRDGNWEIYVMNADGSNQTNLSRNASYDGEPAWSRVGRIAFTSDRIGNYEIYVMGSNGSLQTNISLSTALDNQPAWSPDDTKIVFSSNLDGNNEIYVMRADGINPPTRLTKNYAYDGDPAWSPYGTKITFSSNRDGNWEIYVMNADGSSQTRLTNNPANDAFAAWSPDGTKITFRSDRDGNQEIYVMNADGSNVTRLTNNPAADTQPSWR